MSILKNINKNTNNKLIKDIKLLKDKIYELKRLGVTITDKEGRTPENKIIKYGTCVIAEFVIIYSYFYLFHYICFQDFVFGAFCYALGMYWLFYYGDGHFNIKDYYLNKYYSEKEEKEKNNV